MARGDILCGGGGRGWEEGYSSLTYQEESICQFSTFSIFPGSRLTHLFTSVLEPNENPPLANIP